MGEEGFPRKGHSLFQSEVLGEAQMRKVDVAPQCLI